MGTNGNAGMLEIFAYHTVVHFADQNWIYIWILQTRTESEIISDRMSQNSHFILVTGDFYVWSSTWWKNGLATSERNQVDVITSSYGLS